MARNAALLVLLLLAAPWMPLTHVSLDAPAPSPAGVWTSTDTTFLDGSTEHAASLGPGLSGFVRYATVPGAGLAQGSVDYSLTPSEVVEQDAYSLATGGLSGIAANTSVTANGLVLTTTLGDHHSPATPASKCPPRCSGPGRSPSMSSAWCATAASAVPSRART